MRYLYLIIVLLFIVGCQPNVIIQDKDTQGISVTGMAEKETAPDQIELTIAVDSLAKTALESQAQNTERSNAVIEKLKKENIKEIETVGYTIYEEKDWDPETRKSISRGYKVNHKIKITAEDVTLAGKLADISVKNGANRVDRMEFTLSKDKLAEIKEKLLSAAAESAREKAEILAKSLYAHVGKVKSISETNYGYTPYRYETMAMVESSDTAPKVMPKNVQTSIRINAVFNIA